MFSHRLSVKDHLDNLALRMYLFGVKEAINQGDYSSVREFADDFGYGDGIFLPQTTSELRRYGSWCSFRRVAREYGGVEKVVGVMKDAVRGDEDARGKVKEFIGVLLGDLESKVA